MKRLEEKIPELQARLRPHLKRTPTKAGSSSADSLSGRVEILEEAVETLLEAQVCLSASCPVPSSPALLKVMNQTWHVAYICTEQLETRGAFAGAVVSGVIVA